MKRPLLSVVVACGITIAPVALVSITGSGTQAAKVEILKTKTAEAGRRFRRRYRRRVGGVVVHRRVGRRYGYDATKAAAPR